MKPEDIAQVLRCRLLPTQKILVLLLMVANRPLSMQELLERLDRPENARRTVARQIDYLLKIKVVSIDKTGMAHLYSLARLP